MLLQKLNLITELTWIQNAWYSGRCYYPVLAWLPQPTWPPFLHVSDHWQPHPTSYILHIFTSQQSNFKILRHNRTRIGLNSLANRLHLISDMIPLELLNLSIGSFKVKCKKVLLKSKSYLNTSWTMAWLGCKWYPLVLIQISLSYF